MQARAIITMLAAISLAGAASAAYAADYAPLNCHKASSPAEQTICSSYVLGQSEARMATLFSVATSLVAMGQRGDIQDAQRKWLATRDACGNNVGCLSDAYEQRISALNNVIANIASRGPY
ncbi:MAG TPA: lysozyme inhibitor LprI family protein [Hyphomicrobium sp.]|nr:lysozyme inhibitor LprI family protein [Hyphomicrobium sp.]